MLTQLILHRTLKGLGWKWGRTRYPIWSYLIPLAYAAAVYFPVWILGLGEIDSAVVQRAAERFGLEAFPSPLIIAAMFLIVGIVNLVPNSIFALGEEIGWRGFLVPALARTTGFFGAAVWSGVIWAVWHFPLILLADYEGGTPKWYSVLCFTLMVVSISFAMAWLRLQSGSLWTATIFHASHNLFIQSVFDPLTADTGLTKWIIGEFGCGLVIAGAVVGYLAWRKRSGLPRGIVHETHGR